MDDIVIYISKLLKHKKKFEILIDKFHKANLPL